MAVKKKRNTTDHHGNELLENPEALADQLSRTEEFVEQNKTVVLSIAVALALLVAGFFGYKYYINTQNQKAQNEIFQAVYYFEADSMDLALNGDGNRLGLLDIIDEYGMTDAANLANYYAGVAYLKQGNYEEAINYLKDFSADDLLVQGRAYSLIGDAYMEQQNYDEAANYYQKAADYKSNKYFTPGYLMKAALAYEKANNPDAARSAYDEIIEEYWDSSEVQMAKKYRAKLTTSAS